MSRSWPVAVGRRASAQDPRFHGVNIYMGNLKFEPSGKSRSFRSAK